MKKNYIVIGVFIALIVAGGMMILASAFIRQMSVSTESPIEQGSIGVDQSSEKVGSAAVAILNAQNNSGQDGVAFLSETDEGNARIDLSVSNFPSGAEQPAHVHRGSCTDLGPVLYPLVNAREGVSETALDVSFEELISQLPLAVNVHKSVGEPGVYVSCGNVQMQ